MVGAANELKKAVAGLNLEEIKAFGPASEINWSFCPADAPWQNGSTEALVKSVKRALNVVMAGKICSFAEMQMVMYWMVTYPRDLLALLVLLLTIIFVPLQF